MEQLSSYELRQNTQLKVRKEAEEAITVQVGPSKQKLTKPRLNLLPSWSKLKVPKLLSSLLSQQWPHLLNSTMLF